MECRFQVFLQNSFKQFYFFRNVYSDSFKNSLCFFFLNFIQNFFLGITSEIASAFLSTNTFSTSQEYFQGFLLKILHKSLHKCMQSIFHEIFLRILPEIPLGIPSEFLQTLEEHLFKKNHLGRFHELGYISVGLFLRSFCNILEDFVKELYICTGDGQKFYYS